MPDAASISVLEEQFPHIVQKLQTFWGQEELQQYIQSLIMTERQDREGFPEEAARELLLLESVHQAAFPETKPNSFLHE